MQHPIGEHALLADSRTAALIDPEGTVAWLCWPWIDSTPLFFSILDDARGGGLSLRPARADARLVSRRYHTRSLVLETVWQVGNARLTVEDALALGDGPLLVRSMRAEGDTVDMLATVNLPSWPGTPASLRTHGATVELVGVARVAVHARSDWEPAPHGAVCHFSVQPGVPATITLGTVEARPPAAALDATLVEWRQTIPLVTASSVRPGIDDLLATTAAVLVGTPQARWRHRGGSNNIAAAVAGVVPNVGLPVLLASQLVTGSARHAPARSCRSSAVARSIHRERRVQSRGRCRWCGSMGVHRPSKSR